MKDIETNDISTKESGRNERHDNDAAAAGVSGNDAAGSGVSGCVVVGVDGSGASRAAVDFAAREAARRGVTLEMLHAYDLPVYAADPMGLASVPVDRDALTRSAEALVRAEAARVAAIATTVPIRTVVHEGSASAALVDAGRRADLVAIGARHRSELADVVLGSVGHRVLHHAACPVALVPAAADGAPAGSATHKIVVGVDGSEESRLAMDWAWHEALAAECDLFLVHAWTYPYAAGHRVTVSEPVELVKLDAARLLEAEVAALTARLRPDPQSGAAVPIFHATLREGSPSDELLAEAKDADLVVVGSRGRGGFLSLMLGSVAHQVASHATCPVVVLRGDRTHR